MHRVAQAIAGVILALMLVGYLLAIASLAAFTANVSIAQALIVTIVTLGVLYLTRHMLRLARRRLKT